VWNSILAVWWTITACRWFTERSKYKVDNDGVIDAMNAMTATTIVALCSFLPRAVLFWLSFFVYKDSRLRRALYYVWWGSWLALTTLAIANLVSGVRNDFQYYRFEDNSYAFLHGSGWLLMMKTAFVYLGFELMCTEVVGWWSQQPIKDEAVTATIHRGLAKQSICCKPGGRCCCCCLKARRCMCCLGVN
jgi:hypothetical protein